MGQDYMSRRGFLRFEYPLIIALSVVGMMVMVSAGDLMALYMGLELQSLALYVIAAFKKRQLKSTEAGLKIFCAWSTVMVCCFMVLPLHMVIQEQHFLMVYLRT